MFDKTVFIALFSHYLKISCEKVQKFSQTTTSAVNDNQEMATDDSCDKVNVPPNRRLA